MPVPAKAQLVPAVKDKAVAETGGHRAGSMASGFEMELPCVRGKSDVRIASVNGLCCGSRFGCRGWLQRCVPIRLGDRELPVVDSVSMSSKNRDR